MRILVVEDDHFYAQRVIELLQDHSIEAIHVSAAEEAIAADTSTYNAAIIDVMLPNDPEKSGITEEEGRAGFMAGIGVARRLLRGNANLPVVLLSSGMGGGEDHDWATRQGIPFVRKSDGSAALLQALERLNLLGARRTPRSFIVHGHDDKSLLELKNFIQNSLGWQEPVVLREQPNAGRSIIEKFEDLAGRVDYVFVLLTPDDVVVTSGTNDQKRRSRQNVIFELGFFYSLFGRRSGRVLLLYKDQVEIPTDISGIVWIGISNGVNAAAEEIRREIVSLTKNSFLLDES